MHRSPNSTTLIYRRKVICKALCRMKMLSFNFIVCHELKNENVKKDLPKIG